MNQHKKGWFDYFLYVFFILLIIVTVYPFWYVITYSISDPTRSSLGHYYLTPNGFSLDAYVQVFKSPQILLGFKNSSFITGVGTVLTLLFTASTAYPLSRDHMTGRKVLFNIIFFTMLFSGGMIPSFLIVYNIGLYDTLWALILVNLINVYNMIIMLKFFKGLPASLIESAKIDGYDDISIFFTIVIPLSKAVLASIGLFYAVSLWNMYASAILYTNSKEKTVIQVVVRRLIEDDQLAGDSGMVGAITTPETMKMALIIIANIPIICVYPFLQKHFMKGVMMGSVKG